MVEIRNNKVKTDKPTTEINLYGESKNIRIVKFKQDKLARVYITVDVY